MTRGLLFLLLLSVPSVPAALASSAAAGAAAGVNCDELGFSGLALCSDCDQLASYVKDSKLEAECRQCCLKDDSGDGTKYSAAVLEVCLRRIGLFPDVKTFVEEKAANFPLLQVKNRIGAAPKLLMKDGDGVTLETIRIDNWNTEHVVQYLQEKLVRGDAEVVGSRRTAQ